MSRPAYQELLDRLELEASGKWSPLNDIGRRELLDFALPIVRGLIAENEFLLRQNVALGEICSEMEERSDDPD